MENKVARFMVQGVYWQVISALYALLYNGIKAAPIWDSTIQDFVGKKLLIFTLLSLLLLIILLLVYSFSLF